MFLLVTLNTNVVKDSAKVSHHVTWKQSNKLNFTWQLWCSSVYKPTDDAGVHICWKIMSPVMSHGILPKDRPFSSFQLIPEVQENNPEVAALVLWSCIFSLSHCSALYPSMGATQM